MPSVLANSTAARNFTTLAITNVTQLNALKQRESSAQYVREAAELEFDQPITEIDNNVRRAIFAHWVRNDQERFAQLKNAYKHNEALELAQQQQPINVTTGKVNRIVGHNQMLDPTDVVAIKATIGAALSTVHVNNTYINVIVPEGLRKALFVDWEEQPNVLLLLFGFARDMEIPSYMINANGTRYIIQPPAPPKRGKVGNGYEYKKFGRWKVGGLQSTLVISFLSHDILWAIQSIQLRFFYFRIFIQKSANTMTSSIRIPMRRLTMRFWVRIIVFSFGHIQLD